MEQEPNTTIRFLGLMPNLILPLIGVIIGAVLSWIPMRWQLKNASKEKERERRMSLRRDVYLFAAEVIGQQLSYLANFYQTEESSPKGYTEAITKIHIIGNNETVAAMNEFNDHMAEAFWELIPQKEQIDILEQAGNLLLSPERVALDSKEPQEMLKEFKEIYDKKMKLTYELAGECNQKAQLADELLTPVIVAIRKELDSPFDEEAYRAMMKPSHNKWKKNIEKYIASMKENYTQGMKELLKQIKME